MDSTLFPHGSTKPSILKPPPTPGYQAFFSEGHSCAAHCMLVDEQSQKCELATFLAVAPTSLTTATFSGKGLFELIVRGNISCQEKWKQNQEAGRGEVLNFFLLFSHSRTSVYGMLLPTIKVPTSFDPIYTIPCRHAQQPIS